MSAGRLGNRPVDALGSPTRRSLREDPVEHLAGVAIERHTKAGPCFRNEVPRGLPPERCRDRRPDRSIAPAILGVVVDGIDQLIGLGGLSG